ncbi:hypothetical protein [Leclercia sp.]|uniref:hypothetical protein n=1 Tax=Leclercia sp. TaxID=1898428 RepID=UPI0028AA2A1B|nr:hypothetical protein [Leclercia sp.]
MGAIEQKVTYEVAGKKVNLTAGKCPAGIEKIFIIMILKDYFYVFFLIPSWIPSSDKNTSLRP